ncbi:hypothetical protein IWQ56_004299 [Coemansia nantahalensis]|nr:hypothetical protein IWQ56_004299 [Coemansia nantahalensis]
MAWRRYDRLDWIMPCGALGVDGRFMVGQVNDRVVGPQLLEGTHTLELRVLEHYPDSAVVDGRRVGEPLGVEGFVMLKRDKQRKVEMATYRPALLTTHDGFLFFVHAPRAVRHLDACASGCSSPPAGTEADAEHHPPSAELLFAPPRRPSYKSFASIRSSSSAVAGEPVVRYYHPTADGCSKQMRLAKYMLCITDVEHIVPVAPEAEGTAAGGSDPGRMRSKGRLLSLLRSKKNQQSACKLRLVTRVGTAVELWTASPQCVSEWVHRLTELRYYWTNRMMTDLSLRSRACMLNYAIQGRGNRHRDMVDWSDEGAVAERAIWHACLILGCRSIIMAGVLYRKRDRHQGMQKVFCMLTQGHLIEFAYPPLPLPPAHTALAEHIAGHNPVMAQMFQGADDGSTTPSGAKSPAAHVGGQPSGGADAQLLFSRSRALSLCHCYVVSRFSDDLSTGDIMCEPWVLTDIGNYSGLRLADRMYADGIVSHELITDCIFTVWRPSAVPAILRADGGQALGQIPRDLSDIGEMAPGERSPGSGSESNCSSPRQSIGSAEREHVATPTEKRPAAGCQSAPSSPRAHGGRHWRRASQGTTPHPPDAPRKSGDSILSSASNVSSTSSSPRRDAGRPGAHVVGNEIRLNVDDRHDGRMHMGASRSASKARRRVGVYRARTNAEMAQWVTAINQEIRRMSLTGEW